MSKKKVVVKSTKGAIKTVPTASKLKGNSSVVASKYVPVFSKENYMWMFISIGLIAIGFLLMMGGSMPNPDVWDEDVIYSFRRITLAPIVIIGGFIAGVYSIFK